MHINFETAISNFRKNDQKLKGEKSIYSLKGSFFILPDFAIANKIEVDEFVIYPSERIILYRGQQAYVSKIDFPEWTEYNDGVMQTSRASCTLALSALLSLASGRAVKSFYDMLISGYTPEDVAIHNPVIIAGPNGRGQPHDAEGVIVERFQQIYNIATELSAEDYLDFMRFVRLYQLAMLNRETDHSLSFSLMVSAIESIAFKAVEVEDVKSNWKETRRKCIEMAKAEELNLGQQFIDLLPSMLKLHYAGTRFCKFMLDNAPAHSLEMNSSHNKLMIELMTEMGMDTDRINEIERLSDPLNHTFHENRDNPELQDMLEKLLEDTYKYRSRFYHAGEPTPHGQHGSNERYIKEIYVPISSPSINMKDFDGLKLDVNKLWNQLCNDGFVVNHKFDLDMIKPIDNLHFNGHGAEIRQVFYRKCSKGICVVTFDYLAQIGRLAVLNYISKGF